MKASKKTLVFVGMVLLYQGFHQDWIKDINPITYGMLLGAFATAIAYNIGERDGK